MKVTVWELKFSTPDVDTGELSKCGPCIFSRFIVGISLNIRPYLLLGYILKLHLYNISYTFEW